MLAINMIIKIECGLMDSTMKVEQLTLLQVFDRVTSEKLADYVEISINGGAWCELEYLNNYTVENGVWSSLVDDGLLHMIAGGRGGLYADSTQVKIRYDRE